MSILGRKNLSIIMKYTFRWLYVVFTLSINHYIIDHFYKKRVEDKMNFFYIYLSLRSY